MGKVLAGVSMSLDGYIDDKDGSPHKLSMDYDQLLESAYFKNLIETTGAVILGRNLYEAVDPFAWINDSYEFQVPLFVLTHTPPEHYPKGNDKLSMTFVSDGIESAVSQAKAVAGDKVVQIIGGADTIQQAINAGICDQLDVHILPVVLGGGLKLFENIDIDHIHLTQTHVEEVTPQRTNISYSVSLSS